MELPHHPKPALSNNVKKIISLPIRLEMKMWEETQLNIENQMTALIASKFTHRKRYK